MPITQLQRSALRPLYQEARDAHPGLLIQRGLAEHDSDGSDLKTEHIRRICAIPANEFYINAYNRWSGVTSDQRRFRSLRLPLESRLFIGLSAGGMLETGCAISHSYGMPYIPGSSIKGAVTAFVRATDFGREHPKVCDELFGAEPSAAHPEGLSGAYVFHDAWWIPGSADRPMVQEVVTTYHLEYYGTEGETPATDLDSPIPNAQIAVHGDFLFVIEGTQGWMHLAEEMLVSTLANAGLGAKRRAGYGYFMGGGSNDDTDRCPWVDETISRLMTENRAQEGDTLRSKALARNWQEIEDEALRLRALEDIRARWQAHDWWDQPSGRSARQAKAIYDGAEK